MGDSFGMRAMRMTQVGTVGATAALAALLVACGEAPPEPAKAGGAAAAMSPEAARCKAIDATIWQLSLDHVLFTEQLPSGRGSVQPDAKARDLDALVRELRAQGTADPRFAEESRRVAEVFSAIIERLRAAIAAPAPPGSPQAKAFVEDLRRTAEQAGPPLAAIRARCNMPSPPR